jgi:hypothetical protein
VLVHGGGEVGTERDARFPVRVLHKAVSEELLHDRGDGRQSDWV